MHLINIYLNNKSITFEVRVFLKSQKCLHSLKHKILEGRKK